jgi:hypothetical protein
MILWPRPTRRRARRGARAPRRRKDLQLDRDGHARPAHPGELSETVGSGAAPRSPGARVRRRGWSRSTRRRRRTRGRRSRTGAKTGDRARGTSPHRRRWRAERRGSEKRSPSLVDAAHPQAAVEGAPERSDLVVQAPGRATGVGRASMAERTMPRRAPTARWPRAPTATSPPAPARRLRRTGAAGSTRQSVRAPAAALGRRRSARGAPASPRPRCRRRPRRPRSARLVLDAGEQTGHPRLADPPP